MRNSTLGIEIVIQLCRMQIQRERERLIMTPKMAGALAALKQLQSAGDDVADKLTRRITEETMPALLEAEKLAHVSVDGMHTVIGDIENFTEGLKNSNGGDPLDDSETQSDNAPRSSDVAALRAVK